MAESSSARLTRLLLLVPWLRAHNGVAKADAARHFGLSVAQLEADLSLITCTGPGLYGGELVDIAFEDETITVYDSQGLDQPVQLSADEVAALLLGLQALQQVPGADAAAAASAADKLVRAGHSAGEAVVSLPHSAIADTIADALAAGRDLEIGYAHPLRDDAAERQITPLRLVTEEGQEYLHAWCRTVDAVRTFRLDRITTCRAAGPSAPVPSDDVADTRATATVELPARAAHLLESVPATVVVAGDPLRATVRYADPAWLVQWALASGGDIQVLEPDVMPMVVEHAERALKAYAALSALDNE